MYDSLLAAFRLPSTSMPGGTLWLQPGLCQSKDPLPSLFFMVRKPRHIPEARAAVSCEKFSVRMMRGPGAWRNTMAHPSQSSALEPMVVLEQGHNGEISVVPTMNVLVGTMCKNSFCVKKYLCSPWMGQHQRGINKPVHSGQQLRFRVGMSLSIVRVLHRSQKD